MPREIEAIIHCPTCQVDKATVYRAPATREGVYEHQTEPEVGKHCDVCGAVLERK